MSQLRSLPATAQLPPAVQALLDTQDWTGLASALDQGLPANITPGGIGLLECTLRSLPAHQQTPADLPVLPLALLSAFLRQGLDLFPDTSQFPSPLALALFYGQYHWVDPLLAAGASPDLGEKLLHDLAHGRALRAENGLRLDLFEDQSSAAAAAPEALPSPAGNVVAFARPAPLLATADPATPVPAPRHSDERARHVMGLVACVEALAQAGLDLEQVIPVQGLRDRAPLPYTPIQHAVNNGDDALVMALLAAGASPSRRPPGHPLSPLCLAVRRGSPSLVASLIHAGASLDVEELRPGETLERWHPLVIATSLDLPAMIAQLGAAMTPPQIAQAGPFAMNVAASHGSVACLQALRRLGVAFDVRTTANGYTPLHQAAAGGQVAAIEFLLRRQQRWDIASTGGLTAADVLRSHHPELLEQFGLPAQSSVHMLKPRARP